MCKKFIIFLLLIWCIVAQGEIIYYDDFDGEAGVSLNGTTPDVTTDGAMWEAGDAIDADGSMGSMFTAALPFTPRIGMVYELSATFDNQGDWAAIGFLDEINNLDTRILDNGPLLWSLTRQSGASNNDQAFIGPGTAEALGDAASSSAAELKTRIETKSEREWIVTWFFDGSQEFQQTVDPIDLGITINYVAFGVNGMFSTVTGNISSFKFSDNTAEFLASEPDPTDEAVDVPREVILSWTPGIYPCTHTIYFGTDFNDVNDGTALINEKQADTTYDVGRLEFGTTYYWRVDEVNDSADATVYTGNIWSFTTEPFAIKIPSGNITASASSQSSETEDPENTINESGLDPNNIDLHTTNTTDMWSTNPANFGEPAWIQYDFDKVYKLHQMLVWNYNGEIILSGFGVKDVNIEYSEDGENWTKLAGADQFAKAPGTANYKYNTTVEFNGLAVKAVRINILSNWGGGFYNQFGLSEVRFMVIPVHARESDPDIDEEGVPINVTLSWRDGREAQQHIVSISTDQQAVSGGNAVVDTIDVASYSPLPLDIASDYYWRIDEVNDNEAITTWIGDTWSFRTQEYLVVDDFERYDDDEPNRVWDVWLDGWDDDNNGSTMGYPDPDFALDEHYVETENVHGGSQSAPIFYDNTSASYSEVWVDTTDLPIGSDWTVGSGQTLILWVRGDPNNSPDQLYVRLGDSENIPYDGDLTTALFMQWKIDLAEFNVSLTNVSTLAIRVEGSGAGTLYVDDIVLAVTPVSAEPVDPGTDNLIAKYDMENNLVDSSGSGFDGTFNGGDPNYVAGKYGMALAFDGDDDYVELPIGESISTLESCTISTWVNWSGDDDGDPWSRIFDFGSGTATNLFMTPNSGGTDALRFAIKPSNEIGETQADATDPLPIGSWHHVAAVIDSTNMTMSIYLNGGLVAEIDVDYLPSDLGVTTQNWLGRSQWPDPYFDGMLDDFRIYNKALSDAELRYLFEN